MRYYRSVRESPEPRPLDVGVVHVGFKTWDGMHCSQGPTCPKEIKKMAKRAHNSTLFFVLVGNTYMDSESKIEIS